MNPEANLGGAERSLLDVLWSFRAKHPEIALGLLLGAEGPLEAEAEQLGVTIFRVKVPDQLASLGEAGLRMEWSRRSVGVALSGSTALAAHVAQVNRAIREFRPNVVHTNGVKIPRGRRTRRAAEGAARLARARFFGRSKAQFKNC